MNKFCYVCLVLSFYAKAEVAYDPFSVHGWPNLSSEAAILSPGDIVIDAVNAVDVLNGKDLPRNFRVPLKNWNILMAGSGQFTESGFAAAQRNLMAYYGISEKDIYVVDLREESHGFVNGDAVTWYGGPLAERNKSVEDVQKIENKWIDAVKSTKRTILYQVEKDKKTSFVKTKKPISTQVQSVSSEKNFVEQKGSCYLRIPVTDHFAPTPQSIQSFLDFLRTLPSNGVVFFHCRAGRGRTTTFMTLYTILKKPELALNDIIQKQSDIGGTDIIKTTQKESWSMKPAIQRKKMIEFFYEYVHAADGYGKTKWLDWIQKHHPETMDASAHEVNVD